jgi:predicted ATPase
MIKHLGIMGWLKGPQTPEPKPLSDPRMERDRTFAKVAQIFLQLSSVLPLVLFLDDLQWADPLSLALINYLARKCRDSRLLIIGAYRLEEIVPTKEGLHPLQETIFSMNREDLSTMMELNPLTRNDLPELLTSICHSSLGEEFVEKLYMETEGNPLFTVETLARAT